MVASFSDQVQLPTPGDTPRFADEPSPSSYANHSTSWTPIDSSTPISTNPSRKRSRDDVGIEGSADGSYFPSQQVNTPAPIPEEPVEPVYGEGMTLLNPTTGVSMTAESQTGTWYEEKVDEAAQQQALQQAMAATPVMPVLPPRRKTMRMSQSSVRPSTEEFQGSAPASPSKTAESHVEPDEATMALGIGWTKIPEENESLYAAARGWARYLDVHYAKYIHGCRIILQSSGLNAYLVQANEGYFLFSEDLLEGRFVGTSWNECINNLRSNPMQFAGEQVLTAERTPGPEPAHQSVFSDTVDKVGHWADDHRLNNTQVVEAQDSSMDLD